MEVEFMTADTTLPPCMPLPRAMLRLPISSTAKVMYARMLDIVFLSGIEDANGILYIHFPIVELAAALARSTFVAITNGVDSDKRESSEFAPFLNIMNEWYIRDCSRKITTVLRARGTLCALHFRTFRVIEE